MIGAGTVISPLIKIITTVAILAAVYFFIIKPTLDTTEDITNSVGQSINDSFDDFSPDVQRSVREAKKLAKQSNQGAPPSASQQLQDAQKLLNCINGHIGDTDAILACNNKFGP